MESLLLYAELTVVPLAFAISTTLIKAPYGRFSREGFGALLPGKLTFCCYELVSLLSFYTTLYYFSQKVSNFSIFLMISYSVHYLHRSIVYTFFIAHSMKPQSVMVALGGASFNLLNGYNQAHGVLTAKHFTLTTAIGLAMFIVGLSVNIHSDAHLAGLRIGAGVKDYKIPISGAFYYVTCANYFGEILEWLGWAVMVGNTSMAGWAFWLSTLANLVPRAFSTHQWYLEKFEDYPKGRKILIPYLL